jgi:hypothetical protein
MKKEPVIETPSADIENKRKREEFEKESNLDLLAAVSGECSENVLPDDGNAKSESDSMHSALNTSLEFGSPTNFAPGPSAAATLQVTLRG